MVHSQWLQSAVLCTLCPCTLPLPLQVEGFWRSCQSLPSEQQQWDASRKLRAEISHYQSLLPLLLRLHGPEIRNRHWLQVMTVTGCTLQLEANVFKLRHLMGARLME